MNEPICIARARKAVKIEVKAGDWVILTSPDGTFSEANTAFNKANNPVSEDFSRIIIGKIQHTRPSQNPLSEEQNKVRLAQLGVQDKKVQEIAAGARDRMDKASKAEKAKLEVAKQSELVKANAIVDQVRKSTGYKAS